VHRTRASKDGGRNSVPVILRGPLRGRLRMTDRGYVVLTRESLPIAVSQPYRFSSGT